MQPMSNLIATEQVRGGDWIRVDFDDNTHALSFAREAEGLPVAAMAGLVDTSITIPAMAAVSGASIETGRPQRASGRTTKG